MQERESPYVHRKGEKEKGTSETVEIKNVAVIGAGTMGIGIAQVCASVGYKVYLNDVSQQILDKGQADIQKSLNRFVSRNKISADDMDASLKRLKVTVDLAEAVKEADLIIEAAFEDLSIKKELFGKIDEHALPTAILATNTSSLPIAAIAAATGRPEKVIGLHFMNPVPLMKGVEVIRARLSADESVAAGFDFIRSLGKVPAEAVDYAGFIVSRVWT